jgi:hypothetical protein
LLPITSVKAMRRIPFLRAISCHAASDAINPALAPLPQRPVRGSFGDHTRDVPWRPNVDIFAVGFFVLEWTVYAVALEHTTYGRDSLSARIKAALLLSFELAAGKSGFGRLV